MSFSKYGGQKSSQGVKETKQQMNLTQGAGQVNSAMLIQ